MALRQLEIYAGHPAFRQYEVPSVLVGRPHAVCWRSARAEARTASYARQRRG